MLSRVDRAIASQSPIQNSHFGPAFFELHLEMGSVLWNSPMFLLQPATNDIPAYFLAATS